MTVQLRNKCLIDFQQPTHSRPTSDLLNLSVGGMQAPAFWKFCRSEVHCFSSVFNCSKPQYLLS